ncbi:MAG: hypothetical protein V1740_01950 [Candidatus Woesearchaeota archaeon]
MKKEYKIILIVGLIYLAYILLFLSKFDFHPSGAIIMSQEEVFKHNLTLPDNFVLMNENAYDGQYFYIIATDIFHKDINTSAFRYQRILYPFLILLLSSGNQNIFPIIMLLINFVSIILSTYFLILILKQLRANINLAYLWAFNIGLIISITRDICDPLLFLFIILSFYYLKKNPAISALSMCLAVLTKEHALVFVIPIILYYFIKRNLKKTIIHSAPILVYFIWQIILFFHLKDIGTISTSTHITVPFLGLLKYFLDLKLSLSISTIDYLSIIPILFFIIIQVYIIVKNRNYFTPILLILVFQIIFILSLHQRLFSISGIHAIGRYAMGLFLFSILFSAERKENYNILLLLLSIAMSIIYLLALIFIFKPNYIII